MFYNKIYIVRRVPAQTPCLGKILFLRYGPKCSQPIRLPDYLINPMVWLRDVVVLTTAQLHLTKLELRFCTGSNPAAACQRFTIVRISDNGSCWK